MKWIKSLLIALLFLVVFSLPSFAETNNAKNEDTQTLMFEIVEEKAANDSDKSGMADSKKLLPKTGETNTQFVSLGAVILAGAALAGFIYYKKGKKDYEND